MDLFSRRGVGNHLPSWEGNLGHYQENRAALRRTGILPGQLFSSEGACGHLRAADVICWANLAAYQSWPEHFPQSEISKLKCSCQDIRFWESLVGVFLQESHVIYILVVRTAARTWKSQVKLLSLHSWERTAMKSSDQEDGWGLNKRLSHSRHSVP